MPTLIEWREGKAVLVDDAFSYASDDDQYLPSGDVILSLARFQSDGDRLISEGRRVGVRLTTAEEVEALAYDLPRLSVVALEFPKYRDGRHFTNARLLRERFGFKGQVRAMGVEVIREQAWHMVRCGFDAFAPTDGATSQEWQAAVGRYRHVYQRAADARAPAFAERGE